MLYTIALIQLSAFSLFIILERLFPARQLPRATNFATWFCIVNIFALIWLRVVFIAWAELSQGPIKFHVPLLYEGIIFYMIYSFCNYWIHRFKHMNPVLWRYIHRFHHSPPKMETMVAFFKHPFEIVFNTICITFLGWLFSMPLEAAAIALAIEGCLEVFHHSNIKTPRQLRWIGYIVQTPEMHLVHHQYGLHKYNYVAVLWDGVFGTARIPAEWSGKQGFNTSFDIKYHFLLKKS